MKTRTTLIAGLVICLLIGCIGCAATNPAEESETVETTEATKATATSEEGTKESTSDASTDATSETTPSPTEPPVVPEPYELDFLGIPMIYINTAGEDVGSVYRLAWNLETGSLTEPEYIYKHEGDKLSLTLSVQLMTWPGGNAFSGEEKAIDVKDGIVYTAQEPFESAWSFGPSYFIRKTGELAYYTDEGIMRKTVLATVPEEVYVSDTLMIEPVYAAVNSETVTVVYMDYKSEVVDNAWKISGTYIYTSYLIDDPSVAEWKIAQASEEHHPSVLPTEGGATLIDGKLYMPSLDDILILDLESGELSFLGIKDKIGIFSEGKTNTYPGQFTESVRIRGCYHNILVVYIPLYDTNGIKHYYTVAIKDGEVLGVEATREDNLQRIFYDRNLNETSRSDLFLKMPTLKYAKDS